MWETLPNGARLLDRRGETVGTIVFEEELVTLVKHEQFALGGLQDALLDEPVDSTEGADDDAYDAAALSSGRASLARPASKARFASSEVQ